MIHEDKIPEDYDNLRKYAPTLAGIAKQNSFGVPQDYFEELPDIIQNKIFLSALKNEDVNVPEGYFEELPNIIQSKIFLDSLNKENAFTVPENYFEELAGNIQSRLVVESIGKQQGFEVPQDYFEGLASRITEKTTEQKQPVIISLFRTNFRYVAAAASIALVIGLAFLFSRNETVATGSANIVAAHITPISKQDIKEYLHANLDESVLLEYAFADNNTDQVKVKTDGLEKSDVVDYLLENNIDVSEI